MTEVPQPSANRGRFSGSVCRKAGIRLVEHFWPKNGLSVEVHGRLTDTAAGRRSDTTAEVSERLCGFFPGVPFAVSAAAMSSSGYLVIPSARCAADSDVQQGPL
jgi:hypothetical protein